MESIWKTFERLKKVIGRVRLEIEHMIICTKLKWKKHKKYEK